jgi:plasmid stabilization system protein ParE
MAVIWTEESAQDLRRLFDFLNAKSPEAAQKAAIQILNAANSLLHYPRLGKLMLDSDMRELPASFSRRSYILRYRLDEENTPIIIRVWHSLEERWP